VESRGKEPKGQNRIVRGLGWSWYS
jgi:hypothetical protein